MSRKRYLIFNASCSACNSLAITLERAAAGKLNVIDIESEQAKGILSQAFPEGWEYSPYLITVKGDRVSASSGNKMVLQLGTLLGPQKAWKIYNQARQYGVKLPPGKKEFSSRRRNFIKYTTLLVGSLFVTRIKPLNAKTLLEKDKPRDGILVGQENKPKWSKLPQEDAKAIAAVVKSSEVFNKFKKYLESVFIQDIRESFVIQRDDKAFVAVPFNKYRGNTINNIFVGIVDINTQTLLGSLAWTIEDTAVGHEANFWQNGELKFTATFNDLGEIVINGLPNQDFVAQGQAIKKLFLEELNSSPSDQASLVILSQTFSCLNNCLSAIGVPLYIVGLIGAACSVACAITAGLGCFVCASAIFGAYAGAGVACLQNCGYGVARS